MPLCPHGATVAPGAPDQFVFTEAWILSALGLSGSAPLGIGGFVLLTAMGLPADPVNTADFVAHEPAGDLPTSEDWAKLFFPPWALLTGTYARFGTWLRMAKYAEVAVCNVAPGSDSPTWEVLCTFELVNALPTSTVGATCGSWPDAGTLGLRALSYTATNPYELRWGVAPIPPAVGDDVQSPMHEIGALWGTPIDLDVWQEYVVGAPFNGPPGWTAWVAVIGGSEPGGISGQFQFGRKLPAAEPTAPVPPPYGDPGECPAVDTLQDLADYVCLVDSRVQKILAIVQWLASVTIPPTVLPDTDAPPITPGEPVARPPDAVGAVIMLESIPPYVATYDLDPGVVVAGWAAWGTDEAWFQSVPIRHNPQEIWPMPPHATRLGLNLKPGITARVRWIRSPK